MIKIPEYVFDVAQKLHDSGYEAYLVGGSLRDILLDTIPNDYDIATNALPEKVMEIFPQSIPTGAKFGTVKVLVRDRVDGDVEEVEVTTYRSEKEYVGGRWPASVEFSKNIIDDLKRRDFTVNAMALDLTQKLKIKSQKVHSEDIDTPEEEFAFLHDELLDPFEGRVDLMNKLIRAVGDPVVRFREDGLRTMRACRLASVLSFAIEEQTFMAISEALAIASMISKERVRDEFRKLVEDSPKPSIGIELMRKSGLLQLYIPELLEGFGLEHNHYHVHDVYRHYLNTVDIAPKEIRIAALFHDVGKPRCKDGEHFYEHDQVGAQMTKEILTRLKFPRKFVMDTAHLVRWHMFYLPEESHSHSATGRSKVLSRKSERDNAFKTGWSDAAIRRLIRNVGGHENIDNLLKLRIADAMANPKSTFNPKDIQILAARIADIREQESILSSKDLKISGYDLMDLGFAGAEIKEVLNYLMECVMEDISLNTKEKLIDLATGFKVQNQK